MAQNQRYNGLPLEDPLDHLDQFERLCRTVKINGVPEDCIKMILFPFSLGNKASQWEKNVPSELVSTWEDVKKEFVTKFYPKQKTAKLRNDITSFKQGSHENLYEAWERLKDYTRKCPHHGVSQENLLGIFYRGALEQYRRALDTASYGCFANRTAVEGEQLIENLAQSDACYGGDYDRNMRDQDMESQRYKELNEKLDKLSKVFLVNQKAVNFVGETSYDQQSYNEGVGEDIQGVQEEVNYLGNQSNYQGGYQNNYQQGYQNRPFTPNYGNNNLSYRTTMWQTLKISITLLEHHKGINFSKDLMEMLLSLIMHHGDLKELKVSLQQLDIKETTNFDPKDKDSQDRTHSLQLKQVSKMT